MNGIIIRQYEVCSKGVLDRLRFLPIKKMDQRTCIKFCVKNEIKCADAFRMLTVAYGEATLDRSNVYRWYKMFSEGREDVNDEERAGRPSTSTTDEKINEVEKMILANRRITVREVAEDLNISIGSCHSIFINDLGMRRVAAKFVPKLLNCDQKQHRMNIANEMLDSVRDDPNLLQRVITGVEAWVYGYDVETKAQSFQWKLPHEPRPKKVRQVRSNVKVLLTVFSDCRGVVHHEFLPQGRTVNKEYYLQVMRNLREVIRQKRPDLWKNKNWLLHHDNAPAHTSLLVRDFLAKNNTLMMPQPPYSPNLAPCDFFLFPKLKRPMKGRRVLDRLRFLPIKKMDQRTCIKFCVKNEIKCADAFRMLTVAYGEATLDRSNVYRWYKMFSEGREDVNDEERAGRPSTSTTDEKINEVEKMILANRRITVREVAEDLNISIGSCHSIFINDLGMRRVAAKFVPKLLNCDQKQHRMNIANEMLDSVRDDPNLLQRVITGVEAWVYGYDVETKAQSFQWKLPHEPRPKKARQVRSNVKVLLTVFSDCRGVMHHEFLPQGRTVNKEYYLQVMRNLREVIRQKRPDLWKNKNWLLHHDNAPAHTSLLVRDFLAKNNTLMMPQPPYSPNLAPCDFFLFPKLKRPMKGRRYATLDEIKTASKEELKNIF
ncbi:hypothetical protein LAZ67_1006451 [Cordylochernes scorpioides]|uniref:Mos1 transposase HTH domain-containing protein n=1 Tax=Cordylochernes scorpioides TaxID=51811 RepID=A0ABY6JZ14_9ARAC|nr:hypothetical protein LAZ67_1006451 [Cordylochernes scorpioides]